MDEYGRLGKLRWCDNRNKTHNTSHCIIRDHLVLYKLIPPKVPPHSFTQFNFYTKKLSKRSLVTDHY